MDVVGLKKNIKMKLFKIGKVALRRLDGHKINRQIHLKFLIYDFFIYNLV